MISLEQRIARQAYRELVATSNRMIREDILEVANMMPNRVACNLTNVACTFIRNKPIWSSSHV